MRRCLLLLSALSLPALFLGPDPVLGGMGFRRFLPLAPIGKVVDQDVPVEPKPVENNLIGDTLKTLFSRRADRALAISDETLAADINSLDEVPDSAWFENRIGRQPLRAEDVFWGPCEHDGSATPAPSALLAVSNAKTEGTNPGFSVKDPRGVRYVVKFDPKGQPEAQTSTDVVGGRLFWALGYNVPCDSLYSFRREQLKLKPDVKFRDRETGKERPMTEADLDFILTLVDHKDDGSYACQLSRFIAGKILGGISQEGVRKDDPNDRIPHEDRRALRGLRVFSAWLKHTDLKSDNMLDSFVTQDGRSFIRHYIYDFGEIFAGQAGENGYYRDGFEYTFDPGEIFKSFITLGFLIKPWERVQDTGIRGIGPFGAEPFEFYQWRTLRPNRFMNRMNDLDAFWGVRKLYALSEEHIAAAIRAGAYSDPRAPGYLLDTLKKRRETIAREVLARVNPADAFTLLDGGAALGFEDFAVEHALADAAATSWRVQLVVLGPKEERAQRPFDLREPRIPLGVRLAPDEQLLVRIQTLRAGRPLGDPTHVHIADVAGPGLRIIGIDRWRTGSI
jgi:hypothetical protein